MKDMIFPKYSQCGEDRIVDILFQKLMIDNPSWMDIGAGDPYILSNTAFFYEKGFHGINIEPNPDFYQKLVESRPDDVNLNCAIGSESGILDYYMFDGYPFLNSCCKQDADSMVNEFGYKIGNVLEVSMLTLQQVLSDYCHGQFPDLLSVDIEGMDLNILEQIDYSKSAPKIIIVETVKFGSVKKDQAIKDFLENKGYLAPYETPINTIFVRRDCWEKML